MGRRTSNFTIAITVTILDLAVVYHYGPVLWQVWGGLPWFRIALLLFAVTEALTLADIWGRPLSGFGRQSPLAERNGGGVVGDVRNEELGGADV